MANCTLISQLQKALKSLKARKKKKRERRLQEKEDNRVEGKKRLTFLSIFVPSTLSAERKQEATFPH